MFLYYKCSGIYYTYLNNFWINNKNAPPVVLLSRKDIQTRFRESLWFTFVASRGLVSAVVIPCTPIPMAVYSSCASALGKIECFIGLTLL